MERSILIIYTGGTIGMKQDPVDFTLKPFNFGQILSEVPEIRKFVCRVDTYSFSPLVDSSDAQPEFWIDLARLIKKEYANYDGFVVLHGTDTVSLTASSLSFMLESLEKPVVFPGSQLPIGMLRTDGKENLISAVEIASAADEQGRPIVPEVTVFFDSHLYRGNRTIKYSAENFWAFRSENAPALADTGIHIKYNLDEIRYPKQYRCCNSQDISRYEGEYGAGSLCYRGAQGCDSGDLRLRQCSNSKVVFGYYQRGGPEGVDNYEHNAVYSGLRGYGGLRHRHRTEEDGSG